MHKSTTPRYDEYLENCTYKTVTYRSVEYYYIPEAFIKTGIKPDTEVTHAQTIELGLAACAHLAEMQRAELDCHLERDAMIAGIATVSHQHGVELMEAEGILEYAR